MCWIVEIVFVCHMKSHMHELQSEKGRSKRYKRQKPQGEDTGFSTPNEELDKGKQGGIKGKANEASKKTNFRAHGPGPPALLGTESFRSDESGKQTGTESSALSVAADVEGVDDAGWRSGSQREKKEREAEQGVSEGVEPVDGRAIG